MIKTVKKIKYCKAWVENINARCANKTKWGTSYCGLHYPKKKILTTLLEIFLSGIVGIILMLLLQDPLIQNLSKCPLLHWVDKNKPVIEKITPDIETSNAVDKNTKIFDILFYDKDSGIDLSKSYINVSIKGNNMYEHLGGKLDKTNSNLCFTLGKELKYGEYLLEVVLVDNAGNKNDKFKKNFVVREEDILEFSILYNNYEDYSDKEIFQPFLDEHKDLLADATLYIYYFNMHNKANMVNLKDLCFTVDVPGVIYSWKEVRAVDVKGIKSYQIADTMNQLRYPNDQFCLSQEFVNIDNIGPHGFYEAAILVGKFKRMPELKSQNIWEGIEVYGNYVYEGYGSSEMRKIEFRLPIDQINFKK
jgi:hypothetical protein